MGLVSLGSAALLDFRDLLSHQNGFGDGSVFSSIFKGGWALVSGWAENEMQAAEFDSVQR